MYDVLKEEMDEVGLAAQEEYLLDQLEQNPDNADAMYLLGMIYFNWGEDNSAYKYFSMAAERGYADAIHRIGGYYSHPFGMGVVKPDFAKAIECFTKAAELGSCEAMCHLGYLYTNGMCGLARDFGKAVEFYKRAADLSCAGACKALADCYKYGRGVEKDLEKALEYCEKAYEVSTADIL